MGLWFGKRKFGRGGARKSTVETVVAGRSCARRKEVERVDALERVKWFGDASYAAFLGLFPAPPQMQAARLDSH